MFNIPNNLKSSLLLGAATAASLGIAATSAAAQDVAMETETVVVTGSRIPNRDFSSDSPIMTVTADQIKNTGTIEVTDYLNTLPQLVPAFSSGSNNPPSNGQQQVDLRGLGPNRVVVLMDGRRIMPSNINGTVDIQGVPQPLIASVEVVTGGESAVYGPDAIAGVVNFHMKQDFEGVELDGKAGISDRGDNFEHSESLTLGGNLAGDRGNVVLSYSYAYRRPIFASARPFASQATSSTSYFPQGVFRPTGNTPSQAAVDSYFASHGGAAPGQVSATDSFVINPDGTLFNAGGGGSIGVFNYKDDPLFVANLFCPDPSSPTTCPQYSYNFQPPNLMTLPLQRHNFMAMAHYDITPNLTAYMSANFLEYHSASSLAPSPAPTSPVTSPTGENCGFAYCVPVSNPFIPTDLATLLASRTGSNPDLASSGTGGAQDFLIRTRFLQLGPRLDNFGTDAFQVTGGIKGKLPMNLNFDLYVSYGRDDIIELQEGNVSNSAVEALLYGLGTGNCDGYGGLNLFGVNKSTAEALDCVGRITKNATTTTFTNIEGTINGALWDLPAGQMAFSFGADYREQTYTFIPDPLLLSGDVSGFNAQSPVNGAVYDKDVFGELYVPVLKDQPFAESVSLTFGLRYTDQSNTFKGNPVTWKAEGDWTIFSGVTIRGSYQVATRVPNIGELFSTTFQNNPTLADPCDVRGPFVNGPHGAQVKALCLAQAPAYDGSAYIQTIGQITAISGGNPNLKPETANTFSIGVSWQSQEDNPWVSGLSASLDYWNIDLHSPIGIDFFDILYGCFNIDGSNPTYSPTNANCQRIIRTSSGSISYLNAFETNLSKYQLDGIDLNVVWNLDFADTMNADPDWGSLTVRLAGTWLNHYQVQGAPGALIVNYAGTIGATSPIGLTTDAALPQWKFVIDTVWNFMDFAAGLRANYIGAMQNSLVKVGWGGLPFGPGEVTGVPATWYLDMFGTWNVTKNVSFTAGINNVADQQPRIYNPSQQDGTDPATYDIIGRSYFVAATVKF